MINKPTMLLAIVGFGLLGSASPGYAQAWPARMVKFIAPFAAGGTSDTLGRACGLNEQQNVLLHVEARRL